MSAGRPGERGIQDERLRSVIAPSLHCRRVMVAVDDTRASQAAIPHGIAIATALAADLTLVRVLEAMRRMGDPADPVEWQIAREQARCHIESLALQHADKVGHIETRIIEGRPPDQLCRWARENQVDLTVLSAQGGEGATGYDLGRTARGVLDCASGPVLLVPATAEQRTCTEYRRIFVLMDGSSRAESALPLALRLAEAERAELLLVHAIPEAELTEVGPPEPEDVALRAQLMRRNERVAQDYLERLSAHIRAAGVPVRILLLRNGDVRHALTRAIMDQKPDLIVLASHGHSGHLDVTAGSVATHLMLHTLVPLLLVRDPAHASIGRGVRPLARHAMHDPQLAARAAG